MSSVLEPHFIHPTVAEAYLLSGACPERYQGVLTSGEHFVFALRFGVATLDVGKSRSAAHTNISFSVDYGDDFQGHFESVEDRFSVFSKLLDLWDRKKKSKR